jgi:hypothetical protein
MLQQQMLLQHQLKQQQEKQAQAQAQAQSTQAQQPQQQQANVAQVSQAQKQQPGKQEVMPSAEATPMTSGNHVAPQATPTTATTAAESIWGAKRAHENNGESAKITVCWETMI